MRCTDCGLYECCLRTPLGGCPNGEKVGEQIVEEIVPATTAHRYPKHIELNCNSLAECYARALDLINVSDLGHKASIIIDIDLDSPVDRSYIQISGLKEKL